ncbi:MAG: 30S ribosomal protein S4 [Candidatus Nomurabacteria bacterium]|nr:30S ribosomal protein S4 [Candidatus Nomurabacteria bacterium]USN87925.1 MAG: 30S ribosomal protein S4 [Candidatus Nomurabacteria bacterium]
MKIGPKFKIAKRLGAPIFEKTQSQKFALSQARAGKTGGRPRQMSDYKRQLLEKQKMRFTYGITEKQLRRYVDEAVAKSHQPISLLMERLESRLDNVIYRLGLAKTRRFARQIVSHGHILVNGKKLSIPSHRVRIGDVISVREGSKQTGPFVQIADTHESAGVPNWLSIDIKKLSAKMNAVPVYNPAETLFDPEQVMEYYSR